MKANEAAKVLEQIEEGVTAKIEGAGVEIQRFTSDEDGTVYYWTVNGNTDALSRSDANKRLRGYRADVIEKITYHSPEKDEAQPQKISYIVDEDGLNKYGTPSEVLFAAGQKLDRGEITEEAFLAVSKGDITLDQAVAMADIGRAVESDMKEEEKTESKVRAATATREKTEKKRAKANPARKGEKPKKKEKAAPKPRNLWSILVMDESGDNVEVTVVDAKPFSDFEGGAKGFDAIKAKAVADHPTRTIKTVNVTTGKEYVRRGKKK